MHDLATKADLRAAVRIATLKMTLMIGGAYLAIGVALFLLLKA